MTEIFHFKYVLQNTALREMYTQKQTVSPQTQAVSGGLIIVNIQKFVHQGNSIYFPEITICSTLGLKAAI